MAGTGAPGVLFPCPVNVMRYWFAGFSVTSVKMLEIGSSELDMLPSEIETLEDWVMVRACICSCRAVPGRSFVMDN